MSERLRDELGAMLDAYDGVRRADEQRQRRAESEGLAFLAGFAELRRTVVRPVFEAAGAILKAHGHDFVIAEEEFVFGADGRASRSSCASAWRSPVLAPGSKKKPPLSVLSASSSGSRGRMCSRF